MMTLYDVGMRTIVELPNRQLDALAAICRAEKISRAEAIRCAIDSWIETVPSEAVEAFGLWRERGIDALQYEASLRAEWDRPES